MVRGKASPQPIAQLLPAAVESIAAKMGGKVIHSDQPKSTHTATLYEDESLFPPQVRTPAEYVPTPEHVTLTALVEHGGVAKVPAVDVQRQKSAYRAAGRRLDRTVCFRVLDGDLWIKLEPKRSYRPRQGTRVA